MSSAVDLYHMYVTKVPGNKKYPEHETGYRVLARIYLAITCRAVSWYKEMCFV